MEKYTLTFTVDITKSFELEDGTIQTNGDFKNYIWTVFALQNWDDFKIRNLKVFENGGN